MNDQDLESFVENEIRIAEGHIRKDARFTFIVSILCIGFTATATIGQFFNGFFHGIVTCAILGTLSFFMIRGAARLTEERHVSLSREVKNRTEQLERIRSEKRRKA
ncbi:hypothetical protein [Gymnodinialimonas ulvae]|uniref:hypothetical protein n=1 Tax=Gymnodinialimonas ulvae TaxID=3126504 RepID=UPI003099D955